jgi:hypothetical protein
MNILLGAHLPEYLRPHGHAALPEMRLAEQIHIGAGLSDTAADAQRDFVVQDGLVIGQLEEIKLTGHLKLLLERLFRDSDAHGSQLMATPDDQIQHQDDSVEAVLILSKKASGTGYRTLTNLSFSRSLQIALSGCSFSHYPSENTSRSYKYIPHVVMSGQRLKSCPD